MPLDIIGKPASTRQRGGRLHTLLDMGLSYILSKKDISGKVVGVGTPEDIAANPESHTGRYLQRLLG